MVKQEQIPDEVVDKFYMDGLWMGTPDEARAVIAAALSAWAGAEVVKWYHADQTLILPLPQEARDE